MQSDYIQQRVKMVDGQLRTTDVVDLAILDTMGLVPREEFVDPAMKDLAYIDEDLKIGTGKDSTQPRFLMEPSPLARLLQLAAIGILDKVLDVGCATGYSSAVLSRIAGSVVALECDEALAAKARETLSRLGYGNVTVVTGPLGAGCAAQAPYDVIFVGGAADEVPDALFDQLKDGARLVVVEGHGNAGRSRVYIKNEGVVTGRHAFNAAVKPLPGFERSATFRF